jgi:hypothetical protein
MGDERSTTNQRTDRAKLCWRLFLVFEAAATTLAVWIFRSRPFGAWDEIFFPLVSIWLAFSLPVTFLYLIGKPPVMTLAPLMDSAAERAYWKELRSRPDLTDAEFLAEFCSESNIRNDVPLRLRQILDTTVGWPLLRLHPSDFLGVIDVDFADVTYVIQKRFRVPFGIPELDGWDGRFDSLVTRIHNALEKQADDQASRARHQ